MESSNQVLINGVIKVVYPVIYTVNGSKILRFTLKHQSRRLEGGIRRNVECNLLCLKVNASDMLLNQTKPDLAIKVEGFLANNSRGNLVLHVEQIFF